MTAATSSGLAPVRHVLANGATILAKQTTATPAVAIHAAVRAGVMYEPVDEPGIAHFLARTIDRGTERRTAGALDETLDGCGVSLGVSINRHTLTLSCTCLSQDVAEVLDLVVDVVRRPVFPAAEVARKRQEIITGLRQDQDNPAVQAVEALLALLYGGTHPYGRPSKGTIDDLTRLDRDALEALHRRRVSPAGFVLAMVGDIEAERAVEMATRLLDDWRGAPLDDPGLPAIPGAPARRRVVVPMMNKAQADIAYGFTTIARSDPDYYAFWIMNTVLGQYGLGGRLGDNVRERQGMAYYVFSSFDPAVVPGPLLVRAGVDGGNVDRTIAAIDGEIAAMARDGVTGAELADTRRFLTASMPRLLETNSGIATFLQTAEFFGLGTDYDLQLPGALAAVSLEQVHEAARRLDPARAAIAVAGPYTDSDPGARTG